MMEGHYNKALQKNRKNLIKILATSRMHMYILENLIEIKNIKQLYVLKYETDYRISKDLQIQDKLLKQ
jgi:hypothetical protein